MDAATIPLHGSVDERAADGETIVYANQVYVDHLLAEGFSPAWVEQHVVIVTPRFDRPV